MIAARHGLRAVALFAAALIPFCGCASREAADEGPEETQGDAPTLLVLSESALRANPITTVPAGRHPIERVLRISGALAYDENRVSRIGAPVAGRLARVLAMPGDAVRAGQVLAELEAADASAAVAGWRAARADAGVRLQERDRARALFDRQAVSRAELGRREAELERAEAALAEAARRLALLGVKPPGDGDDRFPAGPVRTRVSSPVAGVVMERSASNGAMAQAGEPLFVVADLSTLWLKLQVFEKDLAFVTPGLPVTVVATAWPDRSFTGTVSRLGNLVDEHSRTLDALVVIANPDASLKPGMSVQAEMTAGEPAGGLTVPAGAVVRLDGGPVVFVRTGEREFKRLAVTTGRSSEDWVEILDGLAEGDAVVTEGAFILKSEAMKSSLAEED